MTIEEIARALEGLSLTMANHLMPADDDPDRACKAYALGLGSAAVRMLAAELRKDPGLISRGREAPHAAT